MYTASIDLTSVDNPDTITSDQHQAEQAALQDTALATPDMINITQRPAYVSETEWLVLQGLAQQHAHPEQELAHLVHKLHFSRQLELWHGMTSPAQRHTLAVQLLEAIPGRVASQDMDVLDARQLQATLLETLVTDPARRAERIDTEARRLTRMITPVDTSTVTPP